MIGRLARSAATVGIAGALVFAVPISAQALLDPVTTSEFVIGAVRAAAPVEAAAGVIGPEGTLLVTTAVTLGALAYVTRDTWMPWVSGLFGAGGASTGTPPALVGGTALWVQTSPTSLSLTIATPYTLYLTSVLSGQCQADGGGPVFTAAVVNLGNDIYTGTRTVPDAVTCSAGSSVLSAAYAPGAWLGGYTVTPALWGAPFDPKTGATYAVASDCIKPDGSTATITATTANPGAGGLLVPSCVAAFGPGSRASNFGVSGGATGAAPHPLSTYPIPTDAQTAVLYPNCVGVGAIACTYIVKYQGAACVVGQAECVNWTLRELARPADYECFYGPYALASVAKCAIDERVYEPNGTRLTKLNTDGDPWTYDSPAPAGMPELQPKPSTGTGTNPGTGTLPGAGTGTLPSPGSAPSTNGDCWSGGAFSWNPVDWVMTPTKCALSWAFVPKTATVSSLASTAKTDLTTQGIGPMVTAVTSNVSKVGGNGSGCTGPSVNFAAVGVTKTFTPFNACAAPMSTIAGISYAMTTVVVVLGGGFAAINAIGQGFGFHFRMRGNGGEAA